MTEETQTGLIQKLRYWKPLDGIELLPVYLNCRNPDDCKELAEYTVCSSKNGQMEYIEELTYCDRKCISGTVLSVFF